VVITSAGDRVVDGAKVQPQMQAALPQP